MNTKEELQKKLDALLEKRSEMLQGDVIFVKDELLPLNNKIRELQEKIKAL